MTGLEQTRSVLSEFGQRHGIADFTLDENGALTLSLEDVAYVFQYNDVLDTLVLMACVGTVPPEARAMVFGQLLSANLFWGETGGCTFAFESSEELVVMQYSLDAATINSTAFEEAFDGLREIAAEWRGRIAEWVRTELEGPSLAQYMDSL